MDYKCHIYTIPGVSNMRDIGGYSTQDGNTIAIGRFIRSTALHKIDADGENALQNIGIDCVIDLRSTLERKLAPDVIENSTNIHYEHVPMLDYIQSNFVENDFTNFPKSMHEMYIGLLEKGGVSFKRVFNLFADEKFNNYIIHCTAGKDRTGVTAMLLQSLAGVDDKTIIEDYSYTEMLIGRGPMGTAPESVPSYLFESQPETMRITLDYIHEKYGSAEKYLQNIGIKDNQIQAIKRKLYNK